MIRPLNNNCLIEVIDEYAGVLRNAENENVQKGVLRDWGLDQYHLTASTGLHLSNDYLKGTDEGLKAFKDKIVYWQEYADSGSKFVIDGKQYVLVPFYRLIGFEDE